MDVRTESPVEVLTGGQFSTTAEEEADDEPGPVSDSLLKGGRGRMGRSRPGK